MSEQILEIESFQLPKKTRAEWLAIVPPLVLGDGELVIEKGLPGLRDTLYEGDGVTVYADLLPFTDKGTARSITVSQPQGGHKLNDLVTIGTIDANANALEKLLAPYVAPTITNTTLTQSLLEYNAVNQTIGIAFRWQKNTGTAAFVSAQIQYKRASSNTWINLPTTVTNSGTNDKIASGSFDTGATTNDTVQFKAVFTDASQVNESAIVSTTYKPKANPSVSGFNVGATTDEKGNTSRTISGTIVRNSPLVALVSAQLYVRVNGGAWNAHGNPVALAGASQAISVPYDGTADKAANTIEFRFYITDAEGTINNATSATVTFQYKIFYGPADETQEITSAIIRGLTSRWESDAATSILNTGTVRKRMIIAVRTGANRSLQSVIDLDALNAPLTASYQSGLTQLNVKDAGNTDVQFNAFVLNLGSPYSPSSHRHQFTI